MSTEFQYDVFLSHNSADKPRVRRLAAGLRVWFDKWERPVASVYDRRRKGRCSLSAATEQKTERGLEASRTLVLCLSPAALGLDWVGLGRSTVGRGNLPLRDLANAGRRFIPLLLASCKFPDIPGHPAAFPACGP